MAVIRSIPFLPSVLIAYLLLLAPPAAVRSQSDTARSKEAYVNRVTRGAGMLPWQQPAPSPEEEEFRRRMEDRKTALLASRSETVHPRMLRAEDIEQAKSNIATSDWAEKWYQGQKTLADFLVAQPAAYVEEMIPRLSPTNSYGFTCPNCVGRLSQEGEGNSLIDWTHTEPDRITCNKCGQAYPDPKFPETAELHCPRMGQSFTFYLNEKEQADLENRTGGLAWKWVGYPMHLSFEGLVRQRKVYFMLRGIEALAYTYRLSGDPRYAERARDALVRMAECYRNWLYQDYWNTMADCDPLYAGWHEFSLPIEFKRHLAENAYAKDTLDKAGMLQTYWGGGRFSASTDSISQLASICMAYDSVAGATSAGGNPVWSPDQREKVERDLLLEWLFGGEPFVGGMGQATEKNNKAPRIYSAMAAVAKCLNLPEFADTGLRGYEAVRNQSFLPDGFSTESPSYTNMYLSQLVQIPELLVGFEWPEKMSQGGTRSENLFETDPQLKRMFAAFHDMLLPDGTFPPLSDTHQGSKPSPGIVEIGLKRYPDLYGGSYPLLNPRKNPTDYALFALSPQALAEDSGLNPPELAFPDWMTGILRHGQGPRSTALTLTYNPPGGHRHHDNLALYYFDSGQAILGDHGYVGDMPVNSWIRSTLSHNLVVVDNQEQLFSGEVSRQPAFNRMVSSPHFSIIEAESKAYPQCETYNRRILLLKGPEARTVAVDLFQVSGGNHHTYRVFSEKAASDSASAALTFTGLELPPEPPLPEVGNSLAKEDIFGLRDTRVLAEPPAFWSATWQDSQGGYRLWMFSQADAVEASNGPGQYDLHTAGRRVRYVDTVQEGEDLDSLFVALHEPFDPDASSRVLLAERLEVPEQAGPGAVALRVETTWGDYLILNRFERPTEVAGAVFEGEWGLVFRSAENGKWLAGVEASTLKVDEKGFSNQPAVWESPVEKLEKDRASLITEQPSGFPPFPAGFKVYASVVREDCRTGYPLGKVDGKQIRFEHFPVTSAKEVRIPAVWFREE